MANETIKERIQRGVENGVLTQEQAEYIIPELKQEKREKIKWDVKDFRTWQFIVSDVLTKKDGIGQYLDDGFCRNIAEYMQKEWSDKLFIEQKQDADNSQHDASSDSNYTPKFKAGDIIIVNDGSEAPFKVNKVLKETYELIGLDEEGDDYHFPIIKTDNQCRLWTIEDAKDGDILAEHESIVIFKAIDGLNIRTHLTYHTLNHPVVYLNQLQKTPYKPATKEEIEDRLKKMDEEGYVWDATDMKVLKIVKPESTEWSDEDERLKTNAIHFLNFSKKYLEDDDNVIYDEKWVNACIDWIEHFAKRIQSQWKPSDEDMKQLDAVINAYPNGSKTHTVLCSLYDELEMLRDNE